MKTLFGVLACALLMSIGYVPLSHAQVVEATTTADGSGLTREEAIQSAIVSAASQAFGMTVRSVTSVDSLAAETSVNGENKDVFLSAINKQVQQQVRSPTNNPILGYSVDAAMQTGDMRWDATVTLRYAKYERLGPDTDRRSVVVTTQDKRYRDILLSNVEESLVGSRRFDVLSRDNQQLFAQEAAFIQSGDAADAEVARLGQASGADYLVIVELQGLSLANNQRETIRMTGEVLVKSAVSGTLKLEVVEFSTRKLKWSGSQRFAATYKGASSVSAGSLAGLISGAADKLMDSLVASIYPIRVVKVMGSTIAVINRGEGAAQKGEIYDVFLMGEELIDPQSGESLGAMEVEVGRGKITDVKPKFSLLKLDSGTLDSTAQYLLRKAGPPPKPAPATKPRPAKPAEPSRKDLFLN